MHQCTITFQGYCINIKFRHTKELFSLASGAGVLYGNIGGQTLQIWEHSVNKCLFALTSNLIKSELLSQYISGLCEQGYEALFPKNRTMNLRPLVPLILYSGVECYIEVQECCIEVEHCCIEVEHCCIAVQKCCIGSAVQCSAVQECHIVLQHCCIAVQDYCIAV